MKRLTKTEKNKIIDDTLDYYLGHPERLGVNENHDCVFFCPGNKERTCAVGRLMSPQERKKHDDPGESWGEAWRSDNNIRLKICGTYRPIHQDDMGFFTYLQSIHDVSLARATEAESCTLTKDLIGKLADWGFKPKKRHYKFAPDGRA